jgi:drug/metabolite transporter (DMT)-like permease
MSRRGWLLFAAMCLIWGLPYLLIRVAVRDLDPAFVVFARTVIGTVVLLPVALRRGALRQVFARWPWLLLFTAIEVTAPWWLLSTAEQHLSSALAGLLVAATPLVGVVVATATRSDERVDARRLVGLAVGFAGVTALVGLQIGHVSALAVGAVLLTAAGYACGPLVLTTRLDGLPAIGVVTASLALTAVVWAGPALASPPHGVSGDVVLATAALALLCTAAAFLVFFALIAEVGPTRATVITYVNPAVAIALGVLVLNERFTTGMAIGFPLVLLGSVLATRSPRRYGVTSAATGATDTAGGPVAPFPLPEVVDVVSVSGCASSQSDKQV